MRGSPACAVDPVRHPGDTGPGCVARLSDIASSLGDQSKLVYVRRRNPSHPLALRDDVWNTRRHGTKRQLRLYSVGKPPIPTFFLSLTRVPDPTIPTTQYGGLCNVTLYHTYPLQSNHQAVRACKAERLNASLARIMCHMPILARNPVDDACTGSISGLLSVNMHALVSPLYYTLAPQLRSTRYILHTQYVPDLANLSGRLVSS